MNAIAVPFTIGNRKLVDWKSSRENLETTRLEDVRDYLKKLERLQAPEDHVRTLNQLHLNFTGGQAVAQWLTPEGKLAVDRLLLSDNGMSQLYREVLPSRFYSGLKDLIDIDDGGAKLATMVWAKFAALHKTPRRVRTVRMKVGNEVYRVIRSCHSQDYAPYSHLQFVQDMLDYGGEYAEMPVVDWHVTDTGMRLRFIGEEVTEVDKPVPMIEAWNSEVGRRKVVLRGGLWRLICTNGMGSWQERTEFSWIHRGDTDRIRNNVKDAFTNLLTTSRGVVEAYENSLEISIENAYEWMTAQLAGEVPDRVITNAQKALHDPTTTPGGLLTSVVDAITLVAQMESDMYAQREVERVAAQVLNTGRGVALANGGVIPVA